MDREKLIEEIRKYPVPDEFVGVFSDPSDGRKWAEGYGGIDWLPDWHLKKLLEKLSNE